MDLLQAKPQDFDAVRGFYHSLIDDMEAAGGIITWVKDVYPSPAFLRKSLQEGTLHLGMEDGQIAAAMVLDGEANESYPQDAWKVAADDSQVMVIHALGVHPRFGGRGLGATMTQAALAIAREQGMKAVRLDVLKGNEPARRIYLKCGFESVGWVQMHYENTGLADFELFERAL